MKKIRTAWMLCLTTLMLAGLACNVFTRSGTFLPQAELPQVEDQAERDIANGQRIYYTGTNQEGERIPYRGGPDFGGMMMGSYLTCAACHGPEARGGTHFMHMQVMDAPDIRAAALQEEAEEHAGEEHDEGDHSTGAAEYTLEDFHQAVVAGKHPDGDPLSREMPRWDLGDEDLADLFTFLKSIP